MTAPEKSDYEWYQGRTEAEGFIVCFREAEGVTSWSGWSAIMDIRPRVDGPLLERLTAGNGIELIDDVAEIDPDFNPEIDDPDYDPDAEDVYLGIVFGCTAEQTRGLPELCVADLWLIPPAPDQDVRYVLEDAVIRVTRRKTIEEEAA